MITKLLLFGNPDIFGICLIKQKFLVSFMPLPFLSVFKEICSLSPLKCAKRGGGTKDKMCVFTIRETFVFSSICQKCQGSQIKAVSWMQSPSLFRGIKTLLFGNPNIFGICLIKQKFLVWYDPSLPLYALSLL